MESMIGNWQGKRIGRYQVTQLLGQSNSCVVCQAVDEQNQQKVAIKMLPAVPASNRAYLSDVATQARAVAALEHPHILAIQDFGELETSAGEVMPYLVMPYVPGGTLAERLQTLNGMLPVYESLRYLRQAARALDYAHHKHMLHRDVRPENMFLRKGWLQLSDFGIVKMISNTSYHGPAGPESRTPEYMAPEVIEGEEVAASDRYSLAVIAYQLFTGHFPFQGKTTHETLVRQVKEQPPEPRQFNTYIPLEVVQVLMRGLAKRPENRPTTCAEFLDALEFGWKASGKSDEGPDTTWLAPWSKRWSEGDESDDAEESGPLPAQTNAIPFNPQQQIDPSLLQSDVPQPVARAERKDNLTPFPQPPAGFAQQSLLARPTTRHKDNLTPFPQPPAPVMPDEEPGEFPEFPSWLPEPFRQSTLSKPAQTAQVAQASAASDQMGFPELPTWIPQPFNKAAIAQPVQSTQAAPPVNEPVAEFPELPSWLPQAFQGAQSNQQAEQPVSPIPPILQPDSVVYQETGQNASNVLQKPLSFDSIVRTVIEKQATGEMPRIAPAPTAAPEPVLPNFGGVRKGESFSGVVKDAIAAQQRISPYVPLHEPLVARDNSAKFEAVVKKVMETEPRIASPGRQAPPVMASVQTPLPGTHLQQTGLQSWEKRVQVWIQQVRPWLQRIYQWSRQRALQAYVWSQQLVLQVYAWVLQLVNSYGSRNEKDRSTRR
jgi:serine/threonine protein kinase